ncbi:transcriptional regulator, partial [Streptomyces sp. ISL-14]|nr:transcriptional regulator [Streptomyces sp. ISL-14]
MDHSKDAPRDDLSAIAALEEPTRRRLYEHVARSSGPVGRDEAAQALG